MQLRRIALLPTLLCLLYSPNVSHAQAYKSIVVFGDSLSDTGNDANLANAKYHFYFPGPVFDYTAGRFTDGYDTIPAARDYKGVWIEQLATMLPTKPTVKDSLDGGKNYAYGFAFTGAGTTLLGFGPYSITINNVGTQIADYLATRPKIDDRTLFVVWAGANDVINATSISDLYNGAINQATNVEALVNAGATQIIVPNLPALGRIPRLVGGPFEAPVTAETVFYNDTLAAGLKIVHDSNPGKGLRIYPLDIFSLINNVIAKPAAYGLANVTGSSQGVFPLNPDTYLFWDDLHPTTHGHNIVATAANEMIQHHLCMAYPKGLDSHNDSTEADWKCELGAN